MKVLVFIVIFTTMNNNVMAEVNSNLKCVDVSMECEYRVKYCYNPSYTGLMFKMCRSTCDWCHTTLDGVNKRVRRGANEFELQELPPPETTVTSGTGTGTCADHYMKCESTASLCNNPSYQSIMHVKCPKTCGVC